MKSEEQINKNNLKSLLKMRAVCARDREREREVETGKSKEEVREKGERAR